MITSRCKWVLLVFLLVAPVQVFAQESVESRVRGLEEKVQLLERRVTSLEAELRERGAQTGVAPGKENWRKLQNGMSEGEVESLLGSPSKVDANQRYFVWWYYQKSMGRVEFDTKSRKVNGWSEPSN